MTGAEALFHETRAETRTEAVPCSHLSLELGHLYMEDFADGPERLRRHFAMVRPWAEAARAFAAGLPTGKQPRISTCFLVDDYFSRLSTPAELLPPLLDAAADAGLSIDYLARESGCVVTDPSRPEQVELAQSVLQRLVESPPPGSNGFRPPVSLTGWLTNGRRAPDRRTTAALETTGVWQPPSETEARGHSVFVDVELWHERERGRVWSCAFLAAVWQLARLGLLRDNGRAVPTPVPCDPEAFPDDWAALPPLVRLNPSAAPFCAYYTCSVLPTRFLPVEHAVRTILEQTHVDPVAVRQIAERSAAEGLAVPSGVVERTSYVFPPGLTT
ncbi:SCO2522 family protein [Streptomyces pseudovenezuelae]|uniref:SCO2522 family protein n=1 Tax=Streptomyces pseudovenezuelae TaxID=67350 RepID=UPI002E80EC8E|nr:SCO2522 family protein [Streptomyces pseudovenezuelae]WUA91094.1 SCO2522 family protein [Streptomyces pseudovenezuelae]